MTDKQFTYDPVATNAALNPPVYVHETGQLWRQFLIAGVVNIAITGTGYTLGWTSPMGPLLLNNIDTPLSRPVTPEELAWIASLLTIGAMFGPFVAGILVTTIGRKWACIAATAPFSIGWILIMVAPDVWTMYVARICMGLGSGMIFTITPMYCAEIATDERRGALGSFLQLFVTVGFLLVYIMGPYTSYFWTAMFGLGLMVVFDVIFFFMPESPFYYLSKNQRERAADSLCKIRGKSRAAVEAELDKIAIDVAATLSGTAKYSDLLERGNLKALGIAIVLILLQQVVGINAILFYMNFIFSMSGSKFQPHIASILVGAVQVGASAITPFVADKLGRRFLLMYSGIFTCIGQLLLGWYFHLLAIQSPWAESLRFLPVLAMIVFIVAFCTGIGPLAYAVMGELFAMEVKAMASTIGVTFTWVSCFLVTRFFSTILEAFGAHVVFWIFAFFCLTLFVFTFFFVPETKGKSFQQIQDMLRNRVRKPYE